VKRIKKLRSENLKGRWDDNIKTDLEAVVCEDVEWIHGAQDRNQRWVLMNTVMNLLVSLGAVNFLTS
jgi:hypothetical protein